ncbi:MAG: ATP-dependent Clp protease ATP-binding subunit [Bacilli bacterium]|nr:ATP-dependent Clp protease ATP-binding subunit [Bacilli bacterium]
MNLFFDEDSQKIIINAKKEMYELRHPYVGSEHLLLSILHSDLDICEILSNYGITYDSFKSRLISIIGIGTHSNSWFLFTPLLRRIINNATYYSKNKSKKVTPYNLFIAILEEGDGVANRILIDMNIDIDKLCDEFLSNDNVIKNSNLLIDDLGVNMNKDSIKYDPVIGRDKEIDRIIQILLRKNKNNPLLIGEAGVGKTAIVEELSRRIEEGRVPLKLKNMTIYSISMSILVAGTKYRGEFEERINKLLTEIVDNPNIILFIDEIHTLVGAGGAEGAIDASNIVKPYLARGNIKVIGATTIDEYNKFISKDKALDRRFQKVYIEETNKESVFNILKGLRFIYEKYHGVVLNKNILNRIVDLSYSSIFNGRQPDKAIDLLDEVCAYATLNNSLNRELLDYEVNIKEVEDSKNREIKRHNFKKALYYKNKELKLRSKYNDKIFCGSKIIINRDDVDKVIYNRYGILEDYSERFRTFNIDKEIVNILEKYDYIKNNSCISLLLVSKNVLDITLLVDKIAKNIYNCNYVVIDMNECREYRNELFESIKYNPFSIIYIKNIDKCNKRVYRIINDSIAKGFIGDINISKCIVFIHISTISSSIGFDDKIICKEGFNNFTKIVNYN